VHIGILNKVKKGDVFLFFALVIQNKDLSLPDRSVNKKNGAVIRFKMLIYS
jgi:hypothetical protein